MNEKVAQSEVVESKGYGKVVFSSDVIAIIAGLAAIETLGVAGMSGNVVEGFTGMLGLKSLTKGVKVEVGTIEAAIDLYVIVKYGDIILDVATAIQQNVKFDIESMTGLHVVEVNVYIQGIEIEKESKVIKEVKEPKEVDKPRVR